MTDETTRIAKTLLTGYPAGFRQNDFTFAHLYGNHVKESIVRCFQYNFITLSLFRITHTYPRHIQQSGSITFVRERMKIGRIKMTVTEIGYSDGTMFRIQQKRIKERNILNRSIVIGHIGLYFQIGSGFGKSQFHCKRIICHFRFECYCPFICRTDFTNILYLLIFRSHLSPLTVSRLVIHTQHASRLNSHFQMTVFNEPDLSFLRDSIA